MVVLLAGDDVATLGGDTLGGEVLDGIVSPDIHGGVLLVGLYDMTREAVSSVSLHAGHRGVRPVPCP